ncbi:MAG: BlaI/MecI/CopY family transcriptional regulator [Gemmatimonadota bacterium]|nr:BlaI/MecI/CopY family transcriptional regulator [Gemmatimonadota bacterium]
MDVVLTGRELDMMSVLWQLGSGTVAEVRERLPDNLAYTTVLTILRTMEEKGYLRHEAEGKAHRYFPLVEEQAARKSALARLIDGLFRGSPELVLTQLVGDRGLTASEARRLRKLLDERLPEGDKKKERGK